MDNSLELVDGIQALKYGTSDLHRILSDDNIGFYAENLTIVILSLNRTEATLKLLHSIETFSPYFMGKIIIADNGSSDECLLKLKEGLKSVKLDCKLVEFNENIGVAKGRNKAVTYVETDWLMFLDNDIYLIKDIFGEIQKSIAKIGCRFLNVPLLGCNRNWIFSYGGHLYVTKTSKDIHIGCGSTFKQVPVADIKEGEECLSTFLFRWVICS